MKRFRSLLLASLLLFGVLSACAKNKPEETESMTESVTGTESALHTESDAETVTGTETEAVTDLPMESVPPHPVETAPVHPDLSAAPAELFDIFENADGTLSVSGSLGEDIPKVLVIPSEIDGKTVTAIRGYGFEAEGKIETLVLPETITTIGMGAFYWCTNLKQVYLPANLREIGAKAFFHCTSLKEIRIMSDCLLPASQAAFAESGLETVYLSDKVTCIPALAFADTSLRDVSVPASVQSIDRLAFADCAKLESVTLREGLLSIGIQAFGSFRGKSNLREIVIPASVTDCEEYALTHGSLERVIFRGKAPANFIDADERAPGNFTILYNATAEGFETPRWQGYACYPVGTTLPTPEPPAPHDGLPEGYVPATPAYPTSPAGDFITLELADGTLMVGYDGTDPHVVIPEKIGGRTVSTIGRQGFSAVRDTVTYVHLPETIRKIDDEAFLNCTMLAEINLPAALDTIGQDAFRGCASLKHVEFWSDCVGYRAFPESGLESVYFSEAVTTIGLSAFSITNLREVDIPGSVKLIDSWAFSDCHQLEKVTLHEGLTEIGAQAFCNYGTDVPRLITEITFPRTLVFAGEYQLSGLNDTAKLMFLGDAPVYFDDKLIDPAHYTIYYGPHAKGFTTPMWNGYACYPLEN